MLVGWNVQAVDSTNNVFSTQTDANGFWGLSLPVGEYQVQVIPPPNAAFVEIPAVTEVYEVTISEPSVKDLVIGVPRLQSTPVCTSAPPDMVAWWTLDGLIAILNPPGFQFLVPDMTGVNYGYPMGITPTVLPGKVQNTLSSTVVVPNDPSLEFGEGDFSIDAWVNLDDSFPGGVLIYKQYSQPKFLVGYELGAQVDYNSLAVNGYFNLGYGGATPPTPNQLLFPLGYLEDGWKHVAVTVDRDGEMRAFVDGQLAGSVNISQNAGFSTDSGAPLTLQLPKLDEVEIFKRVLSVPEIQGLHDAGEAGKCRKPDLRVDDAVVSHQAGQCRVVVTISYHGFTNITGVQVMLWSLDGNLSTPNSLNPLIPPPFQLLPSAPYAPRVKIASMSPGQTVKLEWLSATVHASMLDVFIDPNNSVLESDESNNHRRFSVPAACRFTPSTCLPPPAGLVSWWPFDEMAGTIAADIRGPNPGTLINSPGFVPGKVGGGIKLGNQTFVKVLDDPTLDFWYGNFSIDAWIFPHQTTGLQTIVGKMQSSGPWDP